MQKMFIVVPPGKKVTAQETAQETNEPVNE